MDVRKRDLSEYEPDTLCSIHNSIDRYFRNEILTIRNQNITCVSQKSNVTSNKIKSEKEENPFSMSHGAIINGGTINVHIVTNKRKNMCSSSITNEIVSSQE